MQKLPFLLSASLIGFGALYACSSSSGGDDNDLITADAGPDVKFNDDAPDINLGMGKDFCDKTLGVIKTALTSCCSPTEQSSFTIDLFTQIDADITACETTLEHSIAEHRTAPDPGPYAACINAYTALFAASGTAACGAIDAYRQGDLISDSCLAPFKGVGVVNAPCAGDYDCASGSQCVGYTASTEGKCTTLVPVDGVCGEGPGAQIPVVDNVIPESNTCQGGFYCKAGTCKAQQAPGASCKKNIECSSACVAGACASTAPDPGAAGTKDQPCASATDCIPGLFCDSSATDADGGALGAACEPSIASGTCAPGVDHQCQGKCATSSNTCVPQCGFPN